MRYLQHLLNPIIALTVAIIARVAAELAGRLL